MSSVQGVFQARILEWIAMPFSRVFFFPDTGIEAASLISPELTCRFFTTSAPGKPIIK